jgi:hypothetical protein
MRASNYNHDPGSGASNRVRWHSLGQIAPPPWQFNLLYCCCCYCHYCYFYCYYHYCHCHRHFGCHTATSALQVGGRWRLDEHEGVGGGAAQFGAPCGRSPTRVPPHCRLPPALLPAPLQRRPGKYRVARVQTKTRVSYCCVFRERGGGGDLFTPKK